MPADGPAPRVRFERADAGDAGAIAALLANAAGALAALHGDGPWSRSPSERGVLATMRGGTDVWCAYRGRSLVATWALGRRRPWAIDLRYFSPEPRQPRYLTGMAVAPPLQRRGIGRRCVARAVVVARSAGADVVRLDAYAGAGGAGGFYAACGFREVGGATYRETPLVYFELLLPSAVERATPTRVERAERPGHPPPTP